ncbi:MAG: tetratricopeptide repeat protein [Ignavibacteriaceae bacterium]
MCRKLSLIFILVFLIAGSYKNTFALDAKSMMQKANGLYQNNKFSEAAQLYQKLVDEGYEGTALYYNLGNAYYRINKIGYAILNYERALRLSPGDDDVQHNLALANTKTIDKIEPLPKFFIFQWWESLLALFNLSGWTYTAYIFYILILFSFGIYFFASKPQVQRFAFFSGLFSIIILVIVSTLLIVKLNREVNIKNGVIVEPNVIAKVSPDRDSNDAFVIHEGLKVRLEDNIGNWYKIRLQDGKIGWANKQDIKVI